MTENKETTSGVSTATSGAENGQVDSEGQTNFDSSNHSDTKDKSSDLVSKALKEKSNWRSKALELENKLKSFEDQRLEEKEQYKALAEQRLKEIQELRNTVTQTQQERERARKFNAVREHLVKMGLKQDRESLVFDKLLDVSDLVIDPDTNTVLGAEEKAKDFRKTYADLNLFGQRMPNVNQNAPAYSTQSTKSFKEMGRDELKEQLKQVFSSKS